MRVIDFEAHFFTNDSVDYLKKRDLFPLLEATDRAGSYQLKFSESVSLPHPKPLMDRLLDLGQGRINQMDQGGVDIEILSMTVPSGIECLDNPDATFLARDANDELFSAIRANPSRLKGFAAINPHDALSGVKELERAIKQLGFVGWLTHSNFGKNEYLDEQKFWPLLEAAESLNVPIYLHPSVPVIPEYTKYGFASAGAGFGFQFDTALCLMRMILAGVFDKFPKLTIILGHLGETMPFLMERLDFTYRRQDMPYGKDKPRLDRLPSQVLKENVYVTTSGRFYQPALEYVIKAMGEEKILFATDYPMEEMSGAVSFVRDSTLPTTIITKICETNARVFDL